MKYTYLLINLFTIIVPLFRSFEPRIQYYRQWRYVLPAMCITAIFFLVWDYFKVKYGVWSFNDTYITGIKYFGLPIEEYLFFLTVPYACVFIYLLLRHFNSYNVFGPRTRLVLYAISAVMFFSSFFIYPKAYTFSVCFILGLVLPITLQFLDNNRMDKLVLAFLISLLPMFVVNGFLTALPVVIYNDSQNLGIRLGTIPVEDFAYNAILLAINVSLYEWQVKKSANPA